MNLISYFVLGSLFSLIILGYLKELFHWRYLREKDTEVKKFRKLDAYSWQVNMNNKDDFWAYNITVFNILFPVFRRIKTQDSKKAKYLSLIIRLILWLYYIVLLFFIGLTIYISG